MSSALVRLPGRPRSRRVRCRPPRSAGCPIAAMAADSEFTDLTRRLCCLRGISTLTGFALAVEIGEWHRFDGHSIGAYLGLVPSEHSSGQSRRQGSITKTGNSHARRLLIEAAWHHQPRYTVGPVLRARWEQAPELPAFEHTWVTPGSTSAGPATPAGRRSTRSPTPRSARAGGLVLVPRRAGVATPRDLAGPSNDLASSARRPRLRFGCEPRARS